jgi:hypothetical protein
MSTEKFNSGDAELDALINADKEQAEKKVDAKTETTNTTEEIKTKEKVEGDKKEETDVHINTEKKDAESDTDKVKDDKVELNIDAFNRVFGTEYKSTEDIKPLLESSTQLKELRASLSEKESLIKEKEELLNKKTDGLSLFADETMYKINQVLINNPDLNKEAVIRLASSDLDNMEDVDVLKLQKLVKLKGKGYDESTIEYAINKKYDLVDDPSDLEGEELKQYNANKFLRSEDAQAARDELSKMMKVDVPEKIDLLEMDKQSKEEAKKKLKESLDSWKNKSKDVIKSLDKYTVEFDKGDEGRFDFAYDNEFKGYLEKNLPEYAARVGLDANDPKSMETLKMAIEKDFEHAYLPKMFKAFREDLIAKMEDKDYKRKHNVKDPKEEEAPVRLSEAEKKNKEVDEKVLNDLNKNQYF